MTKLVHHRFPLPAAGLAVALVVSGVLADAQTQPVPNMGQQISPLAPQGSQFGPLNLDLLGNAAWLVGQAVTTVVSPDQKTLLILTSGYNREFISSNAGLMGPFGPLSTEFVFVYDISAATPVKKQILPIIPNSYSGIVFDPAGKAFYVTGGPSDNVHIFALNDSTGMWGESIRSTPLPAWPLALGHTAGGLGVGVLPCAAGVAISKDGQTLVVANYYNDSITVFTGGLGNWTMVPGPSRKTPGLDLRPGKSRATRSPVRRAANTRFGWW